jgi:adenylate cyclase
VSASEARQRLAAILAADAAGYSRLMAADERATVATLDAARTVFRAQIERNQGRVVDMAGDSILAVFETATGAVAASLAIQQQLDSAAGAMPEPRRLRFRIGVHLGEIMEKPDGTVYGDGVNLAARLQALTEPGGIAVSDAVKGAVRSRVPALLVDQGEQMVKNIPNPVRWCRVLPVLAEAGASASAASATATRTAARLVELPSIAILPFRTAGAAVEEASLADGLRIDIQAALVKIAGLMIIGIGTTNSYRGKELPPQQAASEMGARYLLEGFIQGSGNRVRITASLIDGSSGQVVWTERYDRELDDSLEVQDEITERIVTALDVKLLSGEQAKVWRKTLRNSRAREYFYRGLHEYMKGQKEANAAARENFEQVARLAPDSSLGPTMVAFSHWWDAFRGWTATPAQSFDLAAKWAERAMPMEDADGQAHTVMAHIHLLRREHDRALKTAQDAVGLRPSCSNANSHLANILYYCGQPADAADRMRQAMRVTPIHPPWFEVILAASCKETRQWQDAIAAAKEALRKKADDVDARLVLIEVHQATGDVEAARALAREVCALRPDFSVAKWADTQPLKDRAVLDRIAANLRAAGLAP